MSDDNTQEPSAYSIKIDIPEQSDDYEVQIPGLGTFKNGSTYEVSQSEADSYRSYHTRQVTRYNDNREIIGADVELGPSLADAATSMYGVTVTDNAGNTYSQEPPAAPEETPTTTDTQTTGAQTPTDSAEEVQ